MRCSCWNTAEQCGLYGVKMAELSYVKHCRNEFIKHSFGMVIGIDHIKNIFPIFELRVLSTLVNLVNIKRRRKEKNNVHGLVTLKRRCRWWKHFTNTLEPKENLFLQYRNFGALWACSKTFTLPQLLTFNRARHIKLILSHWID